MSLCLSHPNEGYYTNKPVFGTQGDFITSPEISQIFGELLAIWFMARWEAAGRPSPIRLIELGPGRGTLLADMLRTFAQFPMFNRSLQSLWLIEMSPFMRQLQSDVIPNQMPRLDVKWVNHLEEVEPECNGYTAIIAHEFFDALPAHIYVKQETGLHELKVDLGSAERQDQGRGPLFRYALSPQPVKLPFEALQNAMSDDGLKVGSQIEFSPISYATASCMAQLIGKSAGGGSALVVDYGKESIEGDTFRAFKNHNQVHPLEDPGSADLTASVNFALLKAAAVEAGLPVQVYGPLNQNLFLDRMGLRVRLQRLLAQAREGEQQARIKSSALRLVDTSPEGGMGRQYLVMGMASETQEADHAVVWPFAE